MRTTVRTVVRSATGITRAEARQAMDKILAIAKELDPAVDYDLWENSTTRTPLRTLRLRIKLIEGNQDAVTYLARKIPGIMQAHPTSSWNIRSQLSETGWDNHEQDPARMLRDSVITIFYISKSSPPDKPRLFRLWIWRVDRTKLGDPDYTEFVAAEEEIPANPPTPWIYKALVERVSGPYKSVNSLHKELNRLNGNNDCYVRKDKDPGYDNGIVTSWQ